MHRIVGILIKFFSTIYLNNNLNSSSLISSKTLGIFIGNTVYLKESTDIKYEGN